MKPTPVFPEEFLERAKKFAGIEFEIFIQSLKEQPPVSLRINPLKNNNQFSSFEKIVWSALGRYLHERPSFTHDPYFHAGCYYVQDASSQFLEMPFNIAKDSFKHPLKVLDLCAAPGGKSTHILSLLQQEDLLISNEIIPGRNNVLRQNIMKWGNSNVIVTQNDPIAFEKFIGFFDIVVVDAPCSGEGLFRKDAGAMDEWSIDIISRCALRQKDILYHAFSALSPGGFLIYSTCTFEEDENDKQTDQLINDFGMKSIEINFPTEGIVKSRNGLIFYPHKIKGEGFYIALLQKEDGEKFSAKRNMLRNEIKLDKYASEFLQESENFNMLKKDDRLFAIPKNHWDNYSLLSKELYIRLAGVILGDLKGEDLNPSAGLALSNHITKNINHIDLSIDEALKFLKGESITSNDSKGWQIVRFNHFNLGWIKNLGNRTNNYYPKEWRIRK